MRTGAVHGTLRCPLGEPAEVEVAAAYVQVPIVSSGNRWITIRALFEGTAAVATNTWGYYPE